MRAIETALDARGWLGWERRESPPAELEWLEAVHPREHIEAVREHSARSGAFDADTTTSPGSWAAALHAAGGACALVGALLGRVAATGFAAGRPPGHHAERARAMGFCLFNSVAVAARHAIGVLGAERVLVFDWDVHHGNGTNEIFHAAPEVLFCSIHRWPFYPGTGELTDSGSGAGEGYSLNLPVPAGTVGQTFHALVEHVLAPVARRFDPDLLLVSAGFDAHRDDPLGGCLLTTEDYAELARAVRSLAEELGAPVGAVLEGGYDLGSLAASVSATMEGLEPGGAAAASAPADAVTRAAAAQVGRYWEL